MVAILLWMLLVAKLDVDNHEEAWAFGLQFLVLFLWLRRPGAETRARTCALIGILGAGAFLLKPVEVGLWLASASTSNTPACTR